METPTAKSHPGAFPQIPDGPLPYRLGNYVRRVSTSFTRSLIPQNMPDAGGRVKAGTINNTGPAATQISAFILMGKTGAGKSYFIKQLGGKDFFGHEPTVDDGIYSCTKKPAVYLTTIDNKNILFLDTPGFDDSAKANLEVLNDIVSLLYCFALRGAEIQIQGVIFLHDISETRLSGSQKKTLTVLKALVGEERMGNVIIGTTKWSPTGSAKFQQEEQREKALLDDPWRGIYKTSRVYYGDKDMVVQIVSDLFTKPPVILLSQEEMLQPPHTIANTTAGRLAMPEGLREIDELKKVYREQERIFAEEAQRREVDLQKQLEEISRMSKEEAMKEEARKRKKEQEVEQERLLEEKERHGEDMKMWQLQKHDGIRKREQEEKDRRRAEEEWLRIREDLENESRRRVKEARRETERVQRELEDLKMTMKAFREPPKLNWPELILDSVLKWFTSYVTSKDFIGKILQEVIKFAR